MPAHHRCFDIQHETLAKGGFWTKITASSADFHVIPLSKVTIFRINKTGAIGGAAPPSRFSVQGWVWEGIVPYRLSEFAGITVEKCLKLCVQFGEFRVNQKRHNIMRKQVASCALHLLDDWWVAFNYFFKIRRETGLGGKNGTKMCRFWCRKFSGTDTAKRGLSQKKSGTYGHLTTA